MFNRVTMLGGALARQQDIRSQQASLATATGEVASGRKANLGRTLGAGLSVLYRLHAGVRQADALQSAATMVGQRLAATQAAMGQIAGVIGGVQTATLQYALGNAGADPALLASQARQAMSGMVALMNTRHGGESLFGGTDTASLPMRPADEEGGAEQAIRALVDGPVDAASVKGLLDGVDAAFGERYGALFYRSATGTADAPMEVRLGPGQSVRYNLCGDNPGFKDALKGLSLLSLLDASDPATGKDLLDKDAKEAVRARASSLLSASQQTLTAEAGQIGLVQQRVQAAADAQSQAVTAATVQINTLEGVDYYAASAQIEALKVQLQATYSLTSSLSGLSLVNFLR